MGVVGASLGGSGDHDCKVPYPALLREETGQRRVRREGSAFPKFCG